MSLLVLPFAGKGEVIEGWDVGLEGRHLDISSLFFSVISFCLLLDFILLFSTYYLDARACIYILYLYLCGTQACELEKREDL